jgi:hypothetical protein
LANPKAAFDPRDRKRPFFFHGAKMSMTAELKPTTTIAKKRGRPFGTFGVHRRQEQLIAEYTNALGGPNNVTQWERRDIARAVHLQSIAEEKRKHINKHGAASANELIALARLEEVAVDAVEKLRLPVSSGKGFNPREDR